MQMDLSFLPILSAFLFSILFSVYCLRLLLKYGKNEAESHKTPPGETGFPFIGETLDFIFTSKKGVPERFILDRVKKYSSKVFKTSLFGENMVILCGPEGNKFLFLNENKLVRSWWPPSLDVIFGSPGNTNTSEIAVRTHKLLFPHLRPGALEKSISLMDSATKQHLKTYWEGRDVLTVYPLAKHYICTLVCRLFLDTENQEIVTRLCKLTGQISDGIFSLHVNLPGTKFNRALKAKKEMVNHIDSLIEQWKKDFSEQKTLACESVVSEFLRQTIEDDDLSIRFFGLLFAASDTTSSALSSIIMFLAELPHVYEKVLAEQREIARSKRPGETLNLKDIQRMKYTWNVACEAIRIYPPGFGAFKEALCDFTYDGVFVPKGRKIHWNTYATHRNVEYFRDPEKFDPSRFNEDELITPYSYVPFGGGPRMCPGKDYAKIKILVFMHNAVTKFRWEKVFPDEKFSCFPSVKPAKNLPIHLYPHNL